ncbi:MAG: transglutaminase-like domain-containing protein [Nitrospirota bacterium]
MDALRGSADRVRALDTLVRGRFGRVEATLREHSASSALLGRRDAAAAAYEAAADAVLASLSALDAASRGDRAVLTGVLERLINALADVTPSQEDRRPLGIDLPYHPLDLPTVSPRRTPTVTPAYLAASLVAPAPEDLAGTTSDAVAAQAEASGYDPIALFEFVQQSIDTEFYDGVLKGADGALRERRANDADQAVLLVALLRAAGTPARFVHGVIEISAEQAAAWTSVGSAQRAADLFGRAGIPYEPVRRGGGIGAFRIEHTWVEAYVSYGNYRGAPLDTGGKAWVALDPSFKAYRYETGLDVLGEMGFSADALATEYLAQPQTMDPVAVLRARITEYLTANRPGASIDQAMGRRVLDEPRAGLLPNTLPYATVAVTDEFAALPTERTHRVRVRAAADNGDAFDVTLPASEFVGHRITLSYVPATVEDHVAVNAFLRLDNTPAYLVALRPVLKVDGVVRAAGERSVRMGAYHDLTIELHGTRGSAETTDSLLAGGYYALGFGSHAAAYTPSSEPSPRDTEPPAGDLLFQMASEYLDAWNRAEEDLAAMTRVAVVRPLPSVVMVGSVYGRTVLFGRPQTVDWRGVFVDANFRASDAIPAGNDATRAGAFLRLSGLAGSVLERSVLAQKLGAEAVSTVSLIQSARANGEPIEEIDASNASVIASLSTSDNVKAEVTDAVNRGWRVTIPRSDLIRDRFHGIGYIVRDPASGGAGYFISGSLAGGITINDARNWVEQAYADALHFAYTPPPNPDPTAALYIFKVAISNNQNGIAGEPAESPLFVWVLDRDGRPVMGADVTFQIVSGGGQFDAAGAQSVTATTDYLGIAAATPIWGRHTADAPFYLMANAGDPQPTQVGHNLVTARVQGSGGHIPLSAPFQAFAYPGEPHHIRKVLGEGNQSLAGTAAGTLRARVEDQYDNTISNIDVLFRVVPAEPRVGAALPSSAQNMVVYSQDPPCPNENPVIGDCGGVASLAVTTSVFGASVETILGDTIATRYGVQASVPSAPGVAAETFALFAVGRRDYDAPGYAPPTLMMSQLSLVNDRGELLNSAKVGTSFARPLGVALYLIEDRFLMVPTGAPCGPNETDPPCYEVRSLATSRIRPVDIQRTGPDITYPTVTPDAVSVPKQSETANIAFNAIAGGGSVVPPVQNAPGHGLGQGRYEAVLTVGSNPVLNRVEVDATATIWLPDINLHASSAAGTVTPRLVTMRPGQDFLGLVNHDPLQPRFGGNPLTVTHEVFGVRATIPTPPVALIGPSGLVAFDADVNYLIEPAGYAAQTADVDLFEVKTGAPDEWLGYVVGDHASGAGAGTILQGMFFNPAKRYRAKVVLNRGSEVELASGLESLDAYLREPLRLDFGSKKHAEEQHRQKKERDLAAIFQAEKAALVGVIQQGLIEGAACGIPTGAPIAIIEQGSGACFWKDRFATDPVGTCAAFQPEVSDHDYEVFVPSAYMPGTDTSGAACLVNHLNKAGQDSELADVTFFPMSKEDFERGRLNVMPPVVPGGSDPTGDLGLGRQSLLLKWLLEGEYVTGIAGLSVPAVGGQVRPLDAILEDLRTTPYMDGEPTGIPRLEGHEWAALQEFNLFKSGAHLRLKGQAVDQRSGLFERLQKEVHDVAKAGIRAVMARLATDERANRRLFIARPEYNSGAGCLTGTEDPSRPRPPASLFPKRCDSFEEHVASTAVKSLRDGYGLFTPEQTAMIYNLYRVKADATCAAPGCTTRIMDEAEANRFVASAYDLIRQVSADTEAIYLSTVGNDSANAVQRAANLSTARTKALEAQATVKRTPTTRVLNASVLSFENVEVAQDSDATNGVTPPRHVVPVVDFGERFLDVARTVSGSPILDPNGDEQPLMKTALPGDQTRYVRALLDPNHTIRQCEPTANFTGFYAHPLTFSDPGTIPSLPDQPPLPGSFPAPPQECLDHPAPRLRVDKTVNGQPDIKVAPGTEVSIVNKVTNTGAVPLTGVTLTDLLTNRTYGPISLAPGSSRVFPAARFTPTQFGKELIGPTEAVGFIAAGGVVQAWDSVVIDVMAPPCDNAIVLLSPDPNPYNPTNGDPVSEVMQGGSLYRHYRVLDARTGAPIATATVGLLVNGAAQTAQTDADGYMIHTLVPDETDPLGLKIEAGAIGAPGTTVPVVLVSVNGNPSTCGQRFDATVNPREFTRAIKAGSSMKLAASFAAMTVNGKEGFGMDLSLDGTPAGDTKLTFGRTNNVELGVGVKATAAKFRVKLIGTASLANVGVSAGASGFLMLSDKYEFPFPLNLDSTLALGHLFLGTLSLASNSMNPALGGPVTARLLDEVYNRFLGVDAYRVSYGPSMGLKVTAGGSLTGPVVNLQRTGIPLLQDVGLRIGVEGSVDAAVTAAFTMKPPKNEFVTSVEYNAAANISGGLDVGKLRSLPNAPKPSAIAKTVDDVKFRFNGGISGSIKFATTIDTAASPLELKKVEVSISGQKGFGYKLPFGQQAGADVSALGYTDSTEFAVTDPAKIDEAVTTITTIQLLAPLYASPVTTELIGPSLLGERIAELVRLFDQYEDKRERGQGVELPVGLEGALFGTGLEGEVALKLDRSVEYATEKGAVRDGQKFKLETYDKNDPLVPPSGMPVVESIVDQMISAISHEIVSAFTRVVSAIVPNPTNPFSMIPVRFSPSGADLTINNAAEPQAFNVDLLAYKYQPISGPVGPIVQDPSDAAGPGDKPHFGVGGFFQYGPYGKTLAAAATLTIYYEPYEVASLDESSLAIYKWNTAALDWEYVGGTVTPIGTGLFGSVTAQINALGLYTLAPAMPSGKFGYTATATVSSGQPATTTVHYTSQSLRMNHGGAVPDGTLFTVLTSWPDASAVVPFGTVTTPDEDLLTDGVQVRSQSGVIRFTAEYPGAFGAVRVLAYPTEGTAFGEQMMVYP